ncbi:hypothetical protein HF086_014798 [Spodoptera exigua]|uniref:Cytoplasmic tRNA 2-thiolation protein 2 n=1 Tax=Spodoptera exigua TaxID=7107 RepID=A0A922MGL0_SPOEX|nr:hypothetical protein HF086_014798 [Spodoptera exigua]
MNCKKCYSPSTVILRKKDYYCDNCFMLIINHKFRACLGKNKVLIPYENVMIGLSGGVGSTVLLDLVHHATSLENTKKLRISPFCLHLYDDDSRELAESIIKQCQTYKIDVFVVHQAVYINSKYELPEANTLQKICESERRDFKDLMNSMPPSAANDFLLKIKRILLVEFAKKINCSVVFTAETTNTLAVNLLTNLAIGRGSQVQYDVGFCDNRDDKVKIIRPIKDISIEELNYYVSINQLTPVNNNHIKSKSLQSVISSFVSELQDNFQATISTVCKTADKIGDQRESINSEKCLICESDLDMKNMKMSAFEATNVSRIVSLKDSQADPTYQETSDILHHMQNNTNTSVFPLINKYLCYGCSRNHSEMNLHKLPNQLQKALRTNNLGI